MVKDVAMAMGVAAFEDGHDRGDSVGHRRSCDCGGGRRHGGIEDVVVAVVEDAVVVNVHWFFIRSLLLISSSSSNRNCFCICRGGDE